MSLKNTHRNERRKAFAKRESIMRKAIAEAIQIMSDAETAPEIRINRAGIILVDAMNAEKSVVVPHKKDPATFTPTKV